MKQFTKNTDRRETPKELLYRIIDQKFINGAQKLAVSIGNKVWVFEQGESLYNRGSKVSAIVRHSNNARKKGKQFKWKMEDLDRNTLF